MVTAASYGYSEDWWVFYFQLFKHSNKWLEGGGGGVGLPIVVYRPIAMYEMQHTILFRMATFDTGVELLTLDGNVKRVPHLHCSSFFFNLLRLLLFYLFIYFFYFFLVGFYEGLLYMNLVCAFVLVFIRFELLLHTQLSNDRRNSARTTCYFKW